jgi:hypothetical protein
MKKPNGPESVVREIKRKTHHKYFTENKIRIDLEELQGDNGIDIAPSKQLIQIIIIHT